METFKNSFAPLSSLPNCDTPEEDEEREDCDIQENEERHDFLTSLPYHIIGRIISLLPFESAAQTTLLSTQWNGLWNTIKTAHASKDDIASTIFSFITSFPNLKKTTWTKLQLHYDIGTFVLATTVSDKLFLDFSSAKQDLPRLCHWKLQLYRYRKSSSSSASFVKTLYLKSVNRLTRDIVSSLVSQLHCLESLKLVKCNGLQTLDIDGGRKLRNLTVSDCAHLRALCVRADNLQSFRYRGLLPLFWLDSLCLEDAMLDFRKGCNYNSFRKLNFDTLLLALRDVETLTLCKFTFEILIYPWLVTKFRRFKFYELRELWWIQNSVDNMEALMSFLKICPNLEHLFITIDTQSYSNVLTTHIASERFSRAKKLSYLQVVTLEGFTSLEEEILLAEQLREIVVQEPLIVSRSQGNCLRSLVKVPLDPAKMQFGRKNLKSQERKWSYKYMEEVKVCLKHPHMCP